jgi:bifunctional non-homologous end joining protein LigD
MSSVLRELRRHVQRFEPCLPRPAKQPPGSKGWIHEIKHDGFRIMAWRDVDDVRLLSRRGYDFTARFQYAAAAMAALSVRSCLIDAEAIACNERGLADFELIRSYRHDHAVTFCAFDLLEIDGRDLRREPIEKRKDRLADLLRRAPSKRSSNSMPKDTTSQPEEQQVIATPRTYRHRNTF